MAKVLDFASPASCLFEYNFTKPVVFQRPVNASYRGMMMSTQASMQQVARESNTVSRSTILLIGYWIIFVVSFIFPLIAVFVVPAFKDLFQSFGADLPWLTLVVLDYRFVFLAPLPLIFLIPAILVSLERTVEKRTCKIHKIGFAALLILFCIFFITVIWAFYSPIFKMSAVS